MNVFGSDLVGLDEARSGITLLAGRRAHLCSMRHARSIDVLPNVANARSLRDAILNCPV
jgi:hypothetical protein